jgi:hypothetical protein
VIRAEPDPLLLPADGPATATADAPWRRTRKKRDPEKTRERPAFAPPAPVPAWARASGRAGEGETLFSAGAALALLDAFLRRNPPCAGALRQRLALRSAAASAKILRLNADAAALRDLGFAIGNDPGPAARLLRLWQELASRPPSLDSRRLLEAAAALDLSASNADALAESLQDHGRGAEDPVSAAAQAAAFAFSAFPDAPAAEAEILALWVFDLALAIGLRWPRALPLIAGEILDPGLRSDGGGRRARPGDPAWSNTAAGAIARAGASALDLGADLSRRADTLLKAAPKLRAKPAAKIVDLLLAEDCVSPAEAARQAPITDRAARRLFDRLVRLGAVRELTGRPTFRLYGL